MTDPIDPTVFNQQVAEARKERVRRIRLQRENEELQKRIDELTRLLELADDREPADEPPAPAAEPERKVLKRGPGGKFLKKGE